MAPPHVSTFQRFLGLIPSHLEASIAFGLFMESENFWANRAGDPSDVKYRNYQKALTDHDIKRYEQEARQFLTDFANDAVAAKQVDFLVASLAAYEDVGREGHSKFRGWGVVEALAGAAGWTLILIVFWLVLKYSGIDIVEVYHRVNAH
jgi:hypothetical protein